MSVLEAYPHERERDLDISHRFNGLSLSQELQQAVNDQRFRLVGTVETPVEREARLRNGGPNPVLWTSAPDPRDLPAAIVDEARAMLPCYEAALEPLRGTALGFQLVMLCGLLNVAVSEALTPDALQARIEATVIALDAVPEGVLRRETAREALRRFKVFPSVAELVDLLDTQAHDLQTTADALRSIVSAWDVPVMNAPRANFSDEERACVVEGFAQLREERKAKARVERLRRLDGIQ